MFPPRDRADARHPRDAGGARRPGDVLHSGAGGAALSGTGAGDQRGGSRDRQPRMEPRTDLPAAARSVSPARPGVRKRCWKTRSAGRFADTAPPSFRSRRNHAGRSTCSLKPASPTTPAFFRSGAADTAFPGRRSAPHTIRTSAGDLLEVPLTAVKKGSRCWPVGGGGYFRLLPYAVTRGAIEHVNAAGRSAIVYFHPYEFSRARPRTTAHLARPLCLGRPVRGVPQHQQGHQPEALPPHAVRLQICARRGPHRPWIAGPSVTSITTPRSSTRFTTRGSRSSARSTGRFDARSTSASRSPLSSPIRSRGRPSWTSGAGPAGTRSSSRNAAPRAWSGVDYAPGHAVARAGVRRGQRRRLAL